MNQFRDDKGRFCSAQKFAESIKTPSTDEVGAAGSGLLNRFISFSRP